MSELNTGTIKDKCKCTLKDAARGRHCRYCEPQLTIDELEECVKNEKEDWYELEKENDKYKKALEEIIETIPSAVGDYPVYRQDVEMIMIAKEALND